MKIHCLEKINVILAEKMGTSTSKIIQGVSASKLIPGVSAIAMVITMVASLLVVCSLVTCSLEVRSFEACLCWRRVHSRHVYVGGTFV